ncbi:hypothetical protein ASG11_02855 [Sphingomonas sp. Leaf357]|nr:hypothetical protein ASG11_02855 [Sphingomonas sp. Leaf357]
MNVDVQTLAYLCRVTNMAESSAGKRPFSLDQAIGMGATEGVLYNGFRPTDGRQVRQNLDAWSDIFAQAVRQFLFAIGASGFCQRCGN